MAATNRCRVCGRKVPVIGKEDFLKNKRAVGRPQDLADVEHLEKKSDSVSQ